MVDFTCLRASVFGLGLGLRLFCLMDGMDGVNGCMGWVYLYFHAGTFFNFLLRHLCYVDSAEGYEMGFLWFFFKMSLDYDGLWCGN